MKIDLSPELKILDSETQKKKTEEIVKFPKRKQKKRKKKLNLRYGEGRVRKNVLREQERR